MEKDAKSKKKSIYDEYGMLRGGVEALDLPYYHKCDEECDDEKSSDN